MKNCYLQQVILSILLSSLLSGCLPVVFIGAASTTIELSKDQSFNEILNDAKICTTIKSVMITQGFRNLYSKIGISVIQGRVLLTGNIDKVQDSMIATKIAWDQAGVREVINELNINQNSNKFDLIQYMRDLSITSQINAKILIFRDIKFANYKVITCNDFVYLFGIAKSETELEKVANIASNIRCVKKVVSYVTIKI